jgi:hypothetical protein
MGSSTDTHRSPCPPLPKIPELYPYSYLLPGDDHVGESSKNASAAYSTELITKRAQVNDAHLAPPLVSGLGLLTAGVPPVAEYPQLAVPQQEGLYAIDVAAQPVPAMTINGDAFDNFYAQFNDWQSGSLSLPAPVDAYSVDNAPAPASIPSLSYTVDSAPAPLSFPSLSYTADSAPAPASFPSLSYTLDNAPAPASFPSPMVSYTLDNAPAPLPFPSPMVSYTLGNAPIPTPAFLPPYETHYTVHSAPFEYGNYGYPTDATSFETLFGVSTPASFATPGIGAGVYPRTVDVDQGYQGYSYAATAATGVHAGTHGFGLRGLYVS